MIHLLEVVVSFVAMLNSYCQGLWVVYFEDLLHKFAAEGYSEVVFVKSLGFSVVFLDFSNAGLEQMLYLTDRGKSETEVYLDRGSIAASLRHEVFDQTRHQFVCYVQISTRVAEMSAALLISGGEGFLILERAKLIRPISHLRQLLVFEVDHPEHPQGFLALLYLRLREAYQYLALEVQTRIALVLDLKVVFSFVQVKLRMEYS
jgi:hypothetical protein